MTKITREWLQQKIAGMEAVRDEIPFDLDEDDSNTLAALRIALASLEAEPVMYAMAAADFDAEAISTSKSVVDAWVEEWNQAGDSVYRTVPLYTAPPAPVSVPDEMDNSGGVCCEVSYADGWNACRAAMLQDGNSPVTPDGWVMVPVEPTIAMLDEFDSIIYCGAEDSKDAWRRLIAAAPQQEAKS